MGFYSAPNYQPWLMMMIIITVMMIKGDIYSALILCSPIGTLQSFTTSLLETRK